MINKLKLFLTPAIALILVFSLKCPAQAESSLKNSIDRAISENVLSKTAVISVSVRDAKSAKEVYEKDGDLLLHPASTLKAFTTPVMLKYLGAYNEIKTGLYKYKDNFYLKLCGDPLLAEEDLYGLFQKLKINAIENPLFIDDSAIDNIFWGTGWMWDDESNPYMPKYSSYNLDNNVVRIKVTAGRKNSAPVVMIKPYFPVKIINTAVSSNKNNLSIERRPWLDPEAIYISGKVASAVQKTIPVANPEKFFIYRLKQVIKAAGIDFSGNIQKAKVPADAVLAGKITHSVADEVSYINKKSNNLAAETLLKLAGGKFSGFGGTTQNGLKAFRQFYSDLEIDTAGLFIVDASGVSHNNLIQAGWMSFALSKLYNQPEFEVYEKTLASSGSDGTLNNRFRNLAGKLRAKTGTLAGVSGITGYLKADSGKIYSFAILIQNYKGNPLPAKKLENKIIGILAGF